MMRTGLNSFLSPRLRIPAHLAAGAVLAMLACDNPSSSRPDISERRPAGLGEPCTLAGDCSSGFCDHVLDECRRPPRGACLEAEEPDCPSEHVCAPIGPVGGSLCVPRASSEWCFDDGDCPPPAECHPTSATDGRGRCEGPGTVAVTHCNAHTDCPSAQSCIPGDGGGFICGSPAGPQGRCVSSLASSRSCASGLTCNSTGQCVALLNWSCASDEWCADGLACRDGKCAAGAVPLGGACGPNDLCAAGIGCIAAKCSALVSTGQACELSSQCSAPGAICFGGVCAQAAQKAVDSPCDTSDACPAPLVCTADSGVCKLTDGTACASDHQCKSNACVRGRCHEPGGVNEQCGLNQPLSSSGDLSPTLYRDNHCAGDLICHSRYLVCVPPGSGSIWDKASRQIECDETLEYNEAVGECLVPGPGIWAAKYIPIHAVSKGESYGEKACVNLDEVMKDIPEPPDGYRQWVSLSGFDRVSMKEDVGGAKVEYDPAAREVCGSVKGKEAKKLGLFGGGPNNEFNALVVLLVYNPSKLHFFPQDEFYPHEDPLPVNEQLVTIDEDPSTVGPEANQAPITKTILVPPGWDNTLSMAPVWTHEPDDDDGHFIISGFSYSSLEPFVNPSNISTINYDLTSAHFLQFTIAYETECDQKPRLTVQPTVWGWRSGLTGSLARTQLATRKGSPVELPAVVKGAPIFSMGLLHGVPCRYDQMDQTNPFGGCKAILGNTGAASADAVWQETCTFSTPDDGQYKLPYQDEILGIGEKAGNAYCKSTGALSDLCVVGVKVIRVVIEKIIDKLIGDTKGCGGNDCDDDANCHLTHVVTAGGASLGVSLANDESGNTACLVELFVFQLADDALYFDKTPAPTTTGLAGAEHSLCDTDADCSKGLACTAHPRVIGDRECLPTLNSPCVGSCQADLACRPTTCSDSDSGARTCQPRAQASECCRFDEDCVNGLACLAHACYSPAGVPLDPTGVVACPLDSTLLSGACVFQAGGPCANAAWCASGNCDLVAYYVDSNNLPHESYGTCK
jgi:hypothetical protein